MDPITGVYTGMPSPTGIAADPALTSHGVNQSKEMGRHLMTLEPPIEEVYSSPFYRCLQTMAPFMDLQQKRSQEKDAGNVTASSSSGVVVAKMLPEHGIREWFGSAPFDHPEPAAPEKLKSMFPSYDESYESTIVPSKKGETLDQLQQRITIALRGIIKRCDANGTRAIVLCSHAAVIILIGRILTGLVPPSVDAEDFYAYTCGLSVYCRGDAVSEASGRSSGRDAPGFVSNRPTIGTWMPLASLVGESPMQNQPTNQLCWNCTATASSHCQCAC